MKSLGNLTGNGQTTAVPLQSQYADKVFGVDGTAGTFGVAALEVRAKGQTVWMALIPTLTAIDTAKEIRVPLDCEVRVDLSGSTTPDLNYWLG